MTQIETVRGSVEVTDLGRTYMHEHIFTLTPDVQQNYPEEWGDEDRRIEDAATKLKTLAGQGVKTIVDLTVVGLGRFIPRIVRVANQVPELNIIVATGIYTFDSVPFFFRHRKAPKGQPDPMIVMFAKDIESGIADTGVRAGMLKCAIDREGLTPGVERIMRAVAQTHHRTGTPITVHTYPKSMTGLHVKRIMCDEEGVSPERIVLGHSGDTTDCDHLARLVDMGFVLGMDRFGLNPRDTFEARAETLIEMCRRGYTSRMVLSHDASCYIDWLDQATMEALPQWHYLHLGEEVLPYLRERGITDDQIETMLVRTPHDFFARSSE